MAQATGKRGHQAPGRNASADILPGDRGGGRGHPSVRPGQNARITELTGGGDGSLVKRVPQVGRGHRGYPGRGRDVDTRNVRSSRSARTRNGAVRSARPDTERWAEPIGCDLGRPRQGISGGRSASRSAPNGPCSGGRRFKRGARSHTADAIVEEGTPPGRRRSGVDCCSGQTSGRHGDTKVGVRVPTG